MQRRDIRVKAGGGGEFDCYVAISDAAGKVPAVVLASAIHGVDADIRALVDRFAAAGYVGAAPDLFWRTVPGPLVRGDPRGRSRAEPREQVIRAGEADLADTLSALRSEPQFNGRAAAMGFCFGGPYAILGPKRLGYAAGISCHGTKLIDYIGELEDITQPVCIICGDQDHASPPPVREALRAVADRKKNVEFHVFPGVQHGYMMAGNPAAHHPATFEFSMGRALAILNGLR